MTNKITITDELVEININSNIFVNVKTINN